MSKVLLIGGVAHGQMMEDPELGYLEMREPVPDFCFTDCPAPLRVMEIKRSAYRRETLVAGDTKFTVYVDSNLTIDQTMRRLLSHYRPA
jgi:hypothetical protein